jgi:hypothetical protein
MRLRATPSSIKTWYNLTLKMVGEISSGSCPAPVMLLGQSEASNPIGVSTHLGCGAAFGVRAAAAISRRRVLTTCLDVMAQEPPNMTWSTLLAQPSIYGPGVAIDGLQCPLGILKLHLCVFLLLGVHLLLALPLAGRRAILALLLHLFAELFHELLDLSALRRGMARGVMHRALRAAVVTIGRLTGVFVASRPTTAPPVAAGAAMGAPASDWFPPAFFFLLLLLLPPPWASALALGLLSPFAA